MRRRLGTLLRRLADRIDWHGAPRAIGWSFVFVAGEGIRFVYDPLGNREPKGCPLWYLGDDDYAKAFTPIVLSAPRAELEKLRRVPTTSTGPKGPGHPFG